MSNPIIKLKRRPSTSLLGAGAPVGMLDGELAVNFVDSRLYIQGDLPTPLEFADKVYVDGAITSATGSLGTMSTQNANAVNITGGTVTATLDASSQPITNVGAPVNSTDAANKGYIDSAVSALGSVFHYVGDVSSATTPLDLSTLSDLATGAYYKVDVAGAYTDGATTFNAKVGDAFVKTTTGWQKLDNVDAEVLPTANEIAVTGDENVGYSIALDSVFKGRVSDLETKTQNIDLATTANSTAITGEVIVSGKIATTDNVVGVQTAVISPAPGTGTVLFLGGVQIMGPLDMMNNQITSAIIDGGSF